MSNPIKIKNGHYIFNGSCGVYSIKKHGNRWIVSDKRHYNEEMGSEKTLKEAVNNLTRYGY